MATFKPYVIAQRTKVVSVSALIFAIACICQIVAIATPGWVQDPGVTVGLFMFCGSFTTTSMTKSSLDCERIAPKDSIDSLQAVRVMAVLTCAMLVVALVTCCVHTRHVVRTENISHKMVLLCVGFSLLAVVTTLISSIVFGVHTKTHLPSVSQNKYELNYSFGLYVAGGIFTLLGAALVVASIKIWTRVLLV